MEEIRKNKEQLLEEILFWKKRRRAVILAHVYQPAVIQDLADYVGDSLFLSWKAARAEADVIVFCGVHFMAETAAILAPQKTVLLPAMEARCAMADTFDLEKLEKLKAQYPGVPVLAYVNSSAAAKAESDICCTSRNAVDVAGTLPEDSFIFVPDRNLGSYLSRQTGKKVILWDGCCPVHDLLQEKDFLALKTEYPEAVVAVHPECRPAVVDLADYVGSTEGIIDYCRKSRAEVFIIGTERGILHQLCLDNPRKTFLLPLKEKQVCPDMKLVSLENLAASLKNLYPRVVVPEPVRSRAAQALQRMFAASKQYAVEKG